MIRKLIPVGAIAAVGLSLASCSTLTASQQAIVDQVQQGAVVACGFMPTVEGVLSLLGVVPGATEVSGLIKAICGAITPAPAGVAAARRVGAPAQLVVNGKVVTGVYTR